MAARVLIVRATPVNPDPRVEKIARALARGGYAVQVLGWDMTGELPEHEHKAGIAFHRIRLPARFGRGLVNARHQARWQAALSGWLRRHRQEYDLVHACDFDAVLPALLARRLYGKKVVYDIFDFYADMLRATPALAVRAIRALDLWVISNADAVILADAARTEQIAGALPKRLAVIYNAPEDRFDSLDEITSAPKGQGELRIAYVGNLQLERGLLDLLSVVGDHPLWRLDLAGFGGEQEQILRVAGKLQNVVWHKRVDYDRALQLNAAADTLVALYDPTIPNHRYASPNKVFEAMMLGKPVVVARGTNMDQLIEQFYCGLVVEYGDRSSLAGALRKLQLEPEIRRRLGENARRAYVSDFSWSEMEKRLLDLYQQVLR